MRTARCGCGRIEGTGGHGAGLTRHPARGEEVVLALDRPERARLRVQPGWDRESATNAAVRRTLARPTQALTVEAADLEKQILTLVRAWRLDLFDQPGIGAIVAATVLCAWSHPGRVHSEAVFAVPAGTAPIPANSGQVTTRYRLNRHGDRQLSRACTPSRCPGSATTHPPRPSTAAPPTARPHARPTQQSRPATRARSPIRTREDHVRGCGGRDALEPPSSP